MTIVTISGQPGSGKSTVAQLLQKRLGIKYIYSGELFRQLAYQHNMTLEQFGKYCEHHREIDEELDVKQLEQLRKGNVILEGRIAGWIAHKNKISAVKILLIADLETRTRRILKREKGEFEVRKKEIQEREKSEAKRYLHYYGIDIKDTSIYDIVIDTAEKTPEEIVDSILNTMN